MNEPYLEVTFHRGRAIAAYFYLPRRRGDKSQRTAKIAPGMIVDFARGDRPIGIEITAPRKLTVAAMNRALKQLGFPEVKRADLAPLRAA